MGQGRDEEGSTSPAWMCQAGQRHTEGCTSLVPDIPPWCQTCQPGTDLQRDETDWSQVWQPGHGQRDIPPW